MSGNSQIHGDSPLNQKTDLLTYEILINGNKLPDDYNIQSINIHEAVNKISTAEFTVLDGLPEEQDFGLIKKDERIVPGALVKIKLGYHSDNDDVFDGIVLKVGVSVKSGGYSEITAYCVHKAYFMTLSKHSKYFVEKPDSSIISSIIGQYELKSEIETTSIKHLQMIQYDALDWDFIISRAEPNSMIVTTTKNHTIKVSKPNLHKPPALSLVYGVDIIKTELEVDGSFQLKRVTTHSWDPQTQTLISATNTDPSDNEQGQSGKTEYIALADTFNKFDFNLYNNGEMQQSELQQWATAQVLKSKLSRIKGTIQCHGHVDFVANSIVELKGVGKWFDGNAYISEVNHHVQSGNWIVNLTIGYHKDWYLETRSDIISPPAANLIPAMEGLFTGIVARIDGDPNGEFKIKVNIPLITENNDGIWARLLQLHASKSHGTYYVPEIGDEVLIGFLHSDSRTPVILGSLYSSKNNSPYSHQNPNDIKGFVSRSNLKLTYNESDKSITLETPAGRKFIMDDTAQEISLADPLGNSIKMDNQGITINSNMAINIKALQKVTMEGTTGVDVKSISNTNIEGIMVAIKGMSSVDINAVTVNVTGAATAMVKGASVALQGTIAKIGSIIQLG